MQQPDQALCRLCGGKTSYQFSLQVLGKYDVSYSKCEQCESLQTESPYWTREAYSSNLAALDTGAAQRNLANLAATYSISRIFKLKDLLDYGGGDGLLCRFLRDYGINCFVSDKFAQATYAQGFSQPDFAGPQMVLAFEVFEHFDDARKEIDSIFLLDPDALLVTTGIYANQGADWWYLTPETGQHIFFYSEKALRQVADRHGYTLVLRSHYVLFLKRPRVGIMKLMMTHLLLGRIALRIVSAAMRALPTNGVTRDFDLLKQRNRSSSVDSTEC